MKYVKADIVIITALELERRAMVARLQDAHVDTVEGQLLDFGRIGGYRVTIRCLSAMGNVQSAISTVRALRLDQPVAVLLVGIAGGTQRPLSEVVPLGKCSLGDVLIAERVLDYELGKLKPGKIALDGVKSSGHFEMRPREYPCSPLLLQAAKRIRPDHWAFSIRTPRPDGMSGRVLPAAHSGTVASGQKVVTDDAFVDELRKTWSELVGVEMEALGVASAVHDDSRKVHFLMMKSICDWADPEKNDDWQPYAAETAAAFAEALLTSRPVEIRQLLSDAVDVPETSATEQTSEPSSKTWRPSGTKKVTFSRRLIQGWREVADCLEFQDTIKQPFSRDMRLAQSGTGSNSEGGSQICSGRCCTSVERIWRRY